MPSPVFNLLDTVEIYLLDDTYAPVLTGGPGTEIKFPLMSGSVGSTSLTVPSVPPGDYYISVFGWQDDVSIYHLDIMVDGTTKARISDTMRFTLGRYFYFEKPTDLTITISGLTNNGDTLYLDVWAAVPGTQFKIHENVAMLEPVIAGGQVSVTVPGLVGYGIFYPLFLI